MTRTIQGTLINNFHSVKIPEKEDTIDTNTYFIKNYGNTLSDMDASRDMNQSSDTTSNIFQKEHETSYDKEFGEERHYVYKSHIK